MGCRSCGGNRNAATYGTNTIRGTNARPNTLGLYDTASAPECTEVYSGQFQGASVYVVDLNGPNETFFLRAQRGEAVTKARKEKLTLAHLPARQFCHSVMVELLGA